MVAKDAMAPPAPDRANGDLLPRIASAAVLAPAALAIAYVGAPIFELALAAVAGILAWEWTRLCDSRRPALLMILLTLVAVIAVGAVVVGKPRYAALVIPVGAAAAFLAEGSERRLWMMGGAAYIALPLAALEWIRVSTPAGRDLVVWILLVVWASDTFAYIVGRTVGGPKLAPAISPKKTWAGLFGACAGAAAAGAIVAMAMGARELAVAAALAAGLGVLGQGGDLLESSVKRHFHVKDASGIIPGHGGLLDRMDALLAAVLGVAVARLAGWHGGGGW